MKVVLRSDVSQVGKKGDIVEVAHGYARNYLLPKGLAFTATPGVTAQAEAMRRNRDLRDASDRAAAEEVARTLVPRTISITARAGGEGKLFGSISAADVAAAVAEQVGVPLDRKAIHLEEPIKSLGTHLVPTKLHADVEFAITVDVVAS